MKQENESWGEYFEEDNAYKLIITSNAFRFKKYVAEICGPDYEYIYNRRFLRYNRREYYLGSVIYDYCELRDGIYEVAVKYFNSKDAKQPFLFERNIFILYNNESWVFEYYSLDIRTILSIATAIKNGYPFDIPAI